LEEPRPVDSPPAVIELPTAQEALTRLEEFRMAESLTTRRGAPPADPVRGTVVPPPSVILTPAAGWPMTPTTSNSAAPLAVNLNPGMQDSRRQLEDLTKRRNELQTEAERLTKDSTDWESRYAAAKAEVARLEAQGPAGNRLQSIRNEIAKVDASSTRLMQDIEAGRAEQDRRAREVLTRMEPATNSVLTLRDRPMTAPSMTFPALTNAPATAGTPEKKGPPSFQPVGSSRPQKMAAEGNIIRTGRSSEDPAAIERDLSRLNEKRELLTREVDDVQSKFSVAQRELATATRTGVQADIDRWTKESAALDERFKLINTELGKVNSEMQGKVAAMRSAMGVSDPDMVNPGDVIRLIVAEDDSYNADYPVRRDGNISVKGVGRVAVGGKSITEAEAAVKALLEESLLNKATVTLEFAKKVETGGGALPPTGDQTVIIYLAGEFITPGPLKIPEGVAPTLITTIIRSGGITPSGDLTRTKLLRIENGQGAVEEINVAAILSGNIPPTDIALNPGDIIMIPAFAPVVYVTGNVNKPGTLRLFQDETLTAYSAILRAGGFSRFANLKKCTVVRDLGNGEKIQMPLNVKEIQKGLAPDIVLQGKDIVVVPESFFSF
jgi:polysaccharide export outer membrane protein